MLLRYQLTYGWKHLSSSAVTIGLGTVVAGLGAAVVVRYFAGTVLLTLRTVIRSAPWTTGAQKSLNFNRIDGSEKLHHQQ